MTAFEQLVVRAFLELPSVAGLVFAAYVFSRQNARLLDIIERLCSKPAPTENRRISGDDREEKQVKSKQSPARAQRSEAPPSGG